MDEPRAIPSRWRDALVRWSLRTPGLQRWVGRSTALLTFREGRSDRLSTICVAYAQDNGRVLVTADVARHWWRNLAARPDVQVRLAGVAHHGRARVLAGLEALDGYLTYMEARPAAARSADIQTPDGQLDPVRARSELQGTVVVAIDLVPLLTRLPLQVSDRG